MTDSDGFSPLALLFTNPVTAIIGIVAIATLSYFIMSSGQKALSSGYSAMSGAVDDTADRIKSFVNSKTNNATYRNNSVYVLRDNNNDVKYVGRTNNQKRRKNAHSKHPVKKNYTMTVIASGMNKIEAKIMEQTLISAYTLNNLDNARREIARGNVAGYKNSMGNVLSIFNGVAENELLNLMER